VFDREITMAARCHHPNLLQFIGAKNEEVPLIVAEMMHTSLRKVLGRNQLSSGQIIPRIACGLNYLNKNTPFSTEMLALLMSLYYQSTTR